MAGNKYETLGEFELKTLGVKTPAGVSYSLAESSQAMDSETGTPSSGNWNYITIFESLELPYISGYVVVNDGQNMLRHAPIIGQERLLLEFKTPGVANEFVKHDLAIYKVGDRIFSNENNRFQSYRLNFVSRAFLDNTQKKVHKSYKGTISKFVQDIWKDNFSNTPTPEINIEKTKNRHKFIIPYWTPFQTIDWLRERAVPASGNPNYMFYADSDGYNFVPLSRLYQQEPVQSYVNGSAKKREDNIRDFRKEYTDLIEPVEFIRTADKMEDIENGVFSSKLLVHDIRDKTFLNEKVYSYQQDFKPGIEQNPILSATDITGLSFRPETNRLYYPTHKNIHNDIEDNSLSEDWLLQNRSLMEQRNAQQIKICVWGDSRRRVGEIINFKTPSIEPIRSESDWYDKNVSGNYMISEIRHIITKKEHRMWLTLSRDSLPETIPDESTFKGGSKDKNSSGKFLQ